MCICILYFLCSDSEPVERHSNFRLFCCMNPSTDVGKKSLPVSIKNRYCSACTYAYMCNMLHVCTCNIYMQYVCVQLVTCAYI